MKKNEKQKLAQLKNQELLKKLEDEKKRLVQLRMKKETGKLKDLHEYAKKRKDIARIKTIRRQKVLMRNK